MRAPEDLHPDDRAYRVGLRNMLVERREAKHLSQRELGERLGVTQASVWLLEAATSWRLSSVQRWCRALGWRLVLRPEGLPGTAEPDLLSAMRPLDPQAADAWDQAVLVSEMVNARVALGVRQQDLGVLLGTGDRAVGHIERTSKQLMLVTPQRYCRALGGSLAIEVEDVRVGVPA